MNVWESGINAAARNRLRGTMSEKRFNNAMVVLRLLHNRSLRQSEPLTATIVWRSSAVYGRWHLRKRMDYSGTIVRACNDLVKAGLAINSTDGWTVSPAGSLVAIQYRHLLPADAWTEVPQ